MGQIASRAWKNSSGTLLLQPQRTHPCDWQDKDGKTVVAPCFYNLNGRTRAIGKTRTEKQWWHLAFTTSTDAPVRLARQGRFPSQANLPLHGGWRRTPNPCHWPWNVESTIRKAELLKHNRKFECILKTGGYLQLRSFTFLHYTISI